MPNEPARAVRLAVKQGSGIIGQNGVPDNRRVLRVFVDHAQTQKKETSEGIWGACIIANLEKSGDEVAGSSTRIYAPRRVSPRTTPHTAPRCAPGMIPTGAQQTPRTQAVNTALAQTSEEQSARLHSDSERWRRRLVQS